ncbi:NmrA family protein [Anaeromyces robustus]|uniref:NmrA family protein n=1 Tax=Anaeromyces robustus TaxID=1754192 RepID=A0A1Y1XK18_9FUNG|nr:NmrA family protein [Anaeromyces robustus]|eukprot:ORX86107.1 NmrA family protein [Anaeromyces robustus]
MGKIAVVGGTGHYGSKAIDGLLERGVSPSDIVVMYRNEKKALPFKERGMEIRYGDYGKEGYPEGIFKDIEKILFVSGFEMDGLKRIKDHIVVIEAARAANVKQIVYTSFANLYKINCGLEDVHIATERAIKASKIPYTFLRNTFYSEYYLNKVYLKRSIDSGIFYTLAKGRGVNFVSRDDMAKAAAVVLTTEGHLNKAYDITNPKPYTYKDIVEILKELTGKKVELVETTKEEYSAYLDSIHVPKQFQFIDAAMLQQRFVDGWGEICSPELANLIGEENITTPRQFIEKFDFNEPIDMSTISF